MKCISLGVLMVLIFDPFFVHFCRHRPSKMNQKMRPVNQPPLKFWKMEQYIFQHPGSLELCIWWQAPLYLIISPMPSVSPKSSLSLYWLVFSPLKVFYFNFFACSVVWMVNRMRWLPYGAITKGTMPKHPSTTWKTEDDKWMKNGNTSKIDTMSIFEKWMFFGHSSSHFCLHFWSHFSERWDQKMR